MKTSMLLGVILYAFAITIAPPEPEWKEVSENRMTVQWKIENDLLLISAKAPTAGWIAIGFNDSPALKGTQLIMGREQNGEADIRDYYVLKPGVYRPVEVLGGSSIIEQRKVKVAGGFTTISMALPLDWEDEHHHLLSKGKEFSLLMAYSQSKDFDHHSVMRTLVNITL